MRLLSRRAVAALLLLSLSGCRATAPFEAVPQAAEDKGDTRERIGVCYNRLSATPAQVLAIAAQSCGASTTPRLVGQDLSLNACPLLTPVRATFVCNAP